MRKILRVVIVFLQFMIVLALWTTVSSAFAFDKSNGIRLSWTLSIDMSGTTRVNVTAANIAQSEITFYIPKTYEDLRITPALNSTVKSIVSYSCDELIVQCKGVDCLNFSYIWPDGAVWYKGAFYFAGQEKPYVAHGNVMIRLPKNCSVFWIENRSDFEGNVTDELNFKIDSIQPIPSFSYAFANAPQAEVASKTSEHATLHYYKIMEGKPWINKTLELIEEQWSWLKNTLNGTLNHVNVTFAPWGFNDLGTKFWGYCYYNSRNVEILATEQFGIGVDGRITVTLFHELAHALTPLFEDLPSFYSEGIAETAAYDTLRRTSLNKSADLWQEYRFEDAYYYGVEQKLLNYTWFWKWNSTIYDNRTIMDCCYGVSAFMVDYITRHWGYISFNKVNNIFNRTEIEALREEERLPKFIEDLSVSCNEDISHVFSGLATLIVQWNDANHMRKQDYKIQVTGPFTWYIALRLNSLVKDANNEYENRNYDVSIDKLIKVEDLMNVTFWRLLDFMLWISLVMIIGGMIIYIRRRRRQNSTYARQPQ